MVSNTPFDFVEDLELQRDLKDAFLFIVYLIDAADHIPEEKYKEEFYRTIVIYTASIVEALCLFLAKTENLLISKKQLKNPCVIKVPGISVDGGGELVVAVKVKSNDWRDVPFAEIILALANASLISKTLQERLNSLREKRNSQHLYGRGNNRISKEDVKEAVGILNDFREHVAQKLSRI